LTITGRTCGTSCLRKTSAIFDSYYSRWIDYRRDNNHEQVESMEKRMRHVMSRNHIPPDVPFDEIASYGERDHDRDRDRDRDHQ